jgi:hypothetical protein
MKLKVEPYAYEFSGDSTNSYFFTTANDVEYVINFVPSTDFITGYPELEADVFEMIISVADNPTGGRIPADPRTEPTILTIFSDFFRPHRDALIFICDSADGREQARHRKFGLWFYTNAPQSVGELAKLDQIIPDGARQIFLSLIISLNHPQRKLITDIFFALRDEEGK